MSRRKIQTILNTLQLPHTITRISFKIEKYSQWKASEVRTFFLYLALPIMKHFLDEKYAWNLAYIVHGIISRIL